MDSDGNSQVSASKNWLALAELACNWQLKRVNSRKFHGASGTLLYLNLTFMNLYCRTGILIPLKGHCIEFKYYADGIHSGLTPPGNNS